MKTESRAEGQRSHRRNKSQVRIPKGQGTDPHEIELQMICISEFFERTLEIGFQCATANLECLYLLTRKNEDLPREIEALHGIQIGAAALLKAQTTRSEKWVHDLCAALIEMKFSVALSVLPEICSTLAKHRNLSEFRAGLQRLVNGAAVLQECHRKVNA